MYNLLNNSKASFKELVSRNKSQVINQEMSGAVNRRSAFSIYAQEKPEHEVATSKVNDQTRIIHQNNKKKNQNKNRQQHQQQQQYLNGRQNNQKNPNKKQFQNNKNSMKKSYGGVTKPKNNQRNAKQVINKNICHSTPFQEALKGIAQVKKVKTLKPIVENDSDDLEADELIEEQTEIFDSRQEAISLLKKIIYPVKVKEFFANYWEQKPMLIKRENSEYNKAWFSCKEFDAILRNHSLEFTTNIDVTTYIDEVKQNHNTEGRAFAPL